MTTKKWLTGLFILPALMLVFAGCGIQAHIQKEPGVDLGDYKTFSWAPETIRDSANAKPYTNFQENYLKTKIAGELEKKGFKQVKRNADVMVDYDVMVENDKKVYSQPVYSNPFSGIAYNRYSGRLMRVYYPSRYLGNDSYAVPIKSGTITVNLVDNKKNIVTWQGWAETEVDRKKLSTNEIDGIVNAIFKKLKM